MYTYSHISTYMFLEISVNAENLNSRPPLAQFILPKHYLDSLKCAPKVFSTMKGEESCRIFRLIFLIFVGLGHISMFWSLGVCVWVLFLSQRQQ